MRWRSYKVFSTHALILLCSSWSAAQTGATELAWRDFTSEGGRFSVKLPAKPRIGEEPLEKGPIKFVRYTHSVSLVNGLSFAVDYFDMPAGSREPAITRDGGINGFTRPMISQGAKLLSKETIVRGTCEGLAATLSLPGAAPGKMGFAEARIFNSGLRYYFLTFINETDDSAPVREAARTFFESFSVVGGCAAVAKVEEPSAPPVVKNVEGTIDASTAWRKISRPELGFSVLVPGAVRYESQQAQLKPLPLMHHKFDYEDDHSLLRSEVIADYPPNFYDSPSEYQNLMEATIYGLKRNLEGAGFTVAAVRDFNVGDFPGREFSLSHVRLGSGRAQVYATPKRAFVFIGLIRGDKPKPMILDRFFGSIMIAPQ